MLPSPKAEGSLEATIVNGRAVFHSHSAPSAWPSFFKTLTQFDVTTVARNFNCRFLAAALRTSASVLRPMYFTPVDVTKFLNESLRFGTYGFDEFGKLVIDFKTSKTLFNKDQLR